MSIVPTSIMDKCQQFIDKLSELRFLKIKERQVNKFNRLLLKKEGNITWLCSPHAGRQAGSSQDGSTGSKAANASSPQAVSSQAVSTNSQGDSTVPPQAGSSQAESASPQAASASSSQIGSSQAVSTDSQGDSTVPPDRYFPCRECWCKGSQYLSPGSLHYLPRR